MGLAKIHYSQHTFSDVTLTASHGGGQMATADLTRQHHDVLRLLCTGATDKAVGAQLGISDRTVRRLVRDACDHYGVAGRMQLGVILGQLGIVIVSLANAA
jgi:DNA-binding NarL/FixJ family response regulator